MILADILAVNGNDTIQKPLETVLNVLESLDAFSIGSPMLCTNINIKKYDAKLVNVFLPMNQ